MLSHILECLLASTVLLGCASATTVITVNGTASHPIPPLLYGQIFEDINVGGNFPLACRVTDLSSSALLQNRALQQVKPNTTDALYAWSAINGAKINVIADPSPVSSALPNSLQLIVPANASGRVGFGNSGYYGIQVNSEWTYNASFYYKFPATSSFNGTATVALQGSAGQIYASASVQIEGSQTTWKQITLRLRPTASANSTANNFTVTFDAAAAAGQTVNFALFSLFPPTFNNRENGMRIDLANALYDMRPSFFRLPGGNNLFHRRYNSLNLISVDALSGKYQGGSFATRWIWNNTVGPLLNRPGRPGDWGYINTDGLGLLEYMLFCEDLDMEPIMAVWSGYSLDGKSVPENGLGPYIQDAINQINFVIGDPATNKYAALRAFLGHPKPFVLNYVEIGNEDFFSPKSYIYRWGDFVGNLTSAFPRLKFIATTFPFDPILDPVPKEYDLHVYHPPEYFIENAFIFDSYQRNGTYYLQGEYAAVLPKGAKYPIFKESLGEAAYMTGFERNSDIVFGASYATLLMNIASNNPGPTTQLVAFDAANVYPSTSYYVQQLFSTHRGTEYLPSTLPAVNGTLYWSVTRDTNVSSILIKVVNTDAASASITFMLPFQVASSGNLTVIKGAYNASNTPTTPDAVVPKTSSMTFAQVFNYTAPARSISALTARIV